MRFAHASFCLFLFCLVGGCGSDPVYAESASQTNVHDRSSTSFGRATSRKIASPTPTKELLESGYASAVSVGKKAARAPMVEAFPNVIRIPKGVQQRREIWLLCNEEVAVHFEKARFSCGCLEADSAEGYLEPYGSRAIKVTIASVDDSKSDSIVFPFRWNGREWEVKVTIVRE
jgi:hypothetical protein